MRFAGICIGWLLVLAEANSADGPHKDIILNAMRYQAWSGQLVDFPFVSDIRIQRELLSFKNINGDELVGVTTKVTSAYDPSSPSYDLASFYSARTPRVRIVLNYFIPGTALLLSAGYDSGSDAEKIKTRGVKFFGLSTFWRLGSQSAVYLLTGSWEHQNVQELPCVDSYGREYWCPNLTAWKEHTPLEPARSEFFQLKYELKF